MVMAPVLPITKKIEKYNAREEKALEKKIQKSERLPSQVALRSTKVQTEMQNCKWEP